MSDKDRSDFLLPQLCYIDYPLITIMISVNQTIIFLLLSYCLLLIQAIFRIDPFARSTIFIISCAIFS